MTNQKLKINVKAQHIMLNVDIGWFVEIGMASDCGFDKSNPYIPRTRATRKW